MNEIKRYDQALADQLEHIPMLPEDMAWAEMKKMLDEDDDDPVVVPFFKRPGCLLAGLVAALLLIIGGWLYFKRDAAPPVPVSKQVPVNENSTGNNVPPGSGNGTDQPGISATLPDTAANQLPVQGQTGSAGIPTVTGAGTGNNGDPSGQPVSNTKGSTAGRSAVSITKGGFTTGNDTGKNSTKKRPGYSTRSGGRTKVKIVPPATGNDENATELTGENKSREPQYKDPGKMTAVIQPGATAIEDTITKKAPDSIAIVKKDSVPVKKTATVDQPQKEKEAPQEKKKYWQLAAGLGVYQPIPVAGEPAVPYNRYGRKGSLTDYVPSAYLRLYRSRKWFVHAEFRYGAPQAVKPFDYKQQIRDSFQTIIRTIYQLRKTYYHQVPFSVNYFVLPNLSIGAGVIYNRFTGAVARQNVYRSSAAQDTLASSTIISDASDERFVKDHFQWSAEAQYQWKRLSIGARYSSDLTPYIKFTDLNNTGTTIEKKMKALNVFIRYDLWRSKKWGK